MPILPFGCRAYAVKPRTAYSKTAMEPRAWIGINIGRSLLSPGAYNVWVPSIPRVVTTSDVYFDESTYPRLQNSNATTQPVASSPSDPGSDQPPGLPPKHSTEAPALGETIETAASTPSPAHDSLTVLLLFSGPYNRPDGNAAFLAQAGYSADSIDNDSTHGGGGSTRPAD
eukprot:5882155-Pleurochrysis_carterae.AAC.1